VGPPEGVTITMTKNAPKCEGDTNWVAGAGVMDQDAPERYSEKVAALRKSDPIVDWEDADDGSASAAA
jgi:hypothetical protein